MINQQTSGCYEFGAFQLDTRERRLLRAGAAIALTPKAFDLLLALVERHGHLLSKEELFQIVWPDSFVEESNLSSNIALIRKALGDGANGERYIETVPKRGYRFIADVQELSGERAAPMVPVVSRAAAPPRARALAESMEPSAIRSIAVLPFLDLSAQGDHEYFSDGLTEELINVLARVEGLRVVARTSSFQFKGKNHDIREIGRRLNVGAILDGSVRVDERHLRISAHLNDVADGYQLWSETYERHLLDVFAIQEEIAHAIADALKIRLGRGLRSVGLAHHIPNSEAYLLYLRGRYCVNQLTEAGFRQGIQFFAQAIALDPQYGAAFAGMAGAYGFFVAHDLSVTNETRQQAKAAAMQALSIDETLAEAHTALGYIKHLEWDWSGAATELHQALALNPNYSEAYHWHSHHLMSLGQTVESLTASQRALELDPLDPLINLHLAWHYYYARQHELAIEQCRKMLMMDPNFIRAYLFLGLACLELARDAEAIEAFETAIKLSGARPDYVVALGVALARSGQPEEARKIIRQLQHESRHVSPYHLALLHAELGETDEAFRHLEIAYQERSSLMTYLQIDPRLDALRPDARFGALLRRVGFPA